VQAGWLFTNLLHLVCLLVLSSGIVVGTLQEAHDLMESLLSSRVAPAAFGLALLAAGQLSTFTGTIAGQVGGNGMT
jgi:Mn2+/Fe2+ NRAMP family transporter